MGKSAKKGTRWLLILLLAVGAVLLVVFWPRGEEPTEEYQPIEEFKAPYDSIRVHIEKPAPAYDLEKTIRVINGLEIAQNQMGNFEEFLECMARQDYQGVPAEVLESKAKLMPVLQRLYLLQKEHDDLNLWSSLVQRLGVDLIDRIDAGDVTLMTLDQGLGSAVILKEAAEIVFDEYQKEQRLKGELKKEMDEVRLQYLEYLETFTPVYVKYMKEWDLLCLDRDKVYIDLYNNRPDLVLEDSEKVLANYPDNRETMLLRCLGLIQMSRRVSDKEMILVDPGSDSIVMSRRDAYLAEAQEMATRYRQLYPDQSAPMLLLQGLILQYQGDYAGALTYFDQSSTQFPRQSERLADMLDSYRIRTYLTKSHEGITLLNLYRSTMNGSMFFSPNLMKAIYFDQQGEKDSCAKAIYDHFFRRSNQETFDGLVQDIRFCEENLTNSFNQLMPERNYISVSFRKSRSWYGATDDTSIDVTVDNQADFTIDNLTVFLCIHFTDMYAEDYYVIKVPTFNSIPIRESVDRDDIKLDYLDKKFGDIAKVRAFAMTRTKIFWIDNVYNASDKVDYNEDHNLNYRMFLAELDSVSADSRDSYLSFIKKSEEGIRDDIMRYTHVSKRDESTLYFWKYHYVDVELPRELIHLTPTFTWNQSLMPVENYLQGDYIHLSFETVPEYENVLYMTSKYLNYSITILSVGDRMKVIAVENLAEKQ